MPKIKIKLEKGYRVINSDDILYVEASNKHTKIYLRTLEELKSIYPFKFMVAQLEEPSFFRTHHSFIVNTSFIKSINTSTVILQGNKEARISRNKKKLFETYIENI